MSSRWPMVPLGAVAARVERPVVPQAGRRYRQIGVRLWGEGAYERESIDGGATKYATFWIAREGNIVVNKIWARNGSVAVVQRDLDGSVGSNEFPMYEVRSDRLLPQWVHWLTKTKRFWAQCDEKSRGTSGKNRIRPEKFLEIEIPLPPLAEQRRLVERIDAFAAKIEEAKRLRTMASRERGYLIKAALNEIFDRCSVSDRSPRVPLREAATISRGKFAHRPRNEPRFYGGDIPFIQIGDISESRQYIRRFGQTLNEHGLQISRMFPRGTVVIAITGATIGVTGILDFDTCFPDSIVGMQPIPGVTTSEFIYWAIEYEKHKALSQATQTTQPNINLKKLDSLTIPLLEVDEQTKLVKHLGAINDNASILSDKQGEVQAELDAMLPAILARAFKGELHDQCQ